MNIKFSKYEGLGNDFIIVERPEIDDQLSRVLCDRRRGIGADGVLVVMEGTKPADYEMLVWNADGSRAEMCGNGLRCVGRYLSERKRKSSSYLIKTGAGLLTVQPKQLGISAEVGAADDLGAHTIELNGQQFCGRWMSTGNPHFVLYGQWDLEEMKSCAPHLERHQLFPDGANISFAHLNDDGSIQLTVWERGCGFTQACGTGACATVAAGQINGQLSSPIIEQAVHLPGGTLMISGSIDSLVMQGPARHVFDGVWPGYT